MGYEIADALDLALSDPDIGTHLTLFTYAESTQMKSIFWVIDIMSSDGEVTMRASSSYAAIPEVIALHCKPCLDTFITLAAIVQRQNPSLLITNDKLRAKLDTLYNSWLFYKLLGKPLEFDFASVPLVVKETP